MALKSVVLVSPLFLCVLVFIYIEMPRKKYSRKRQIAKELMTKLHKEKLSKKLEKQSDEAAISSDCGSVGRERLLPPVDFAIPGTSKEGLERVLVWWWRGWGSASCQTLDQLINFCLLLVKCWIS